MYTPLAREKTEREDNRQMREAAAAAFCFAASINRFAQIVLFDVALLIRKNRAGAEEGANGRTNNASARHHGLFRSRIRTASIKPTAK